MNEFKRDDEWQQRLATRFLDPFYRKNGWHITRYPSGHPMQRMHVDVTLTKNGEERRIDEKIMRGLRKGGAAEKVNLETWSCSVPGIEKRGWCHPEEANRSTHLFACHAEEVSEISPDSWKRVTFLDCIYIPFPPLRQWFWEQGEERWERFVSEQLNHSIARKVPIEDIVAANLGLKRFQIDIPLSDATFTGYCDCGAPGLYVAGLVPGGKTVWQCNEHRTV